MIDPFKLKFEINDKNCQYMLIFSICVAGKKAKVIQKALNKLYSIHLQENEMPFDMFLRLDNFITIEFLLKNYGIGCYTLKAECIREIINSNVNLHEKDLEYWKKFRGMGYKTINYYLMQLYPSEPRACLDTHILKFLREKGHDVPKATPGNAKRYKEIEQIFLQYVPSNKTPQEFDLEIWTKFASQI